MYLLFAIAINASGYAALLFLGWTYHDWLLYDLQSLYGLSRRLVIPFASAAALPFAVYYYKKLTDHFTKDDNFDNKVLRQCGHFALVLFTTLFILFVFSPTYITAGAREPIQSTVLATVILVLTGVSMVLGAGVFLLRGKYKYVEGIITGLLVLCFINAFILPFQVEVLDGRTNFLGVQDNPLPFIRSVLLLIILSGLWTIFRKQLRFTVIPLFLIALVFTGVNIHSMSSMQPGADESTSAADDVLKSASTFSSSRNVVVIVMDMMQGSIVERTFEEYPQFFESFDGFTIFTRAFSSFPFTRFSVISIHSGKLYPSEDPTYDENILHSYKDSFMMDMQNEGLHVNMLGSLPEINQRYFPFTSGITDESPWSIYNSATSASLARVTGYLMRSPFTRFNEARTREWEGTVNERFIDWMASDSEMMEILINELSVSDEDDKLLYFWHFGTHTPVITTKDGQLEISNIEQRQNFEQSYIEEAYFYQMQLSRLFDAMKEQGVYDNSLIIITSDHGIRMNEEMILEHGRHMEDFVDGMQWFGNVRPVHMYNSIMMVKPPDSRGEAIMTHDPAWSGDVRELINRYFMNFTNIPPKDMVAEIRAGNPVVGVAVARIGSTHADMFHTAESHEVIFIESLFDIAAAFSAYYGTIYD